MFDDKEVEEALAAGVERRIEEIESGRDKMIPLSEAIARVRTAVKDLSA